MWLIVYEVTTKSYIRNSTADVQCSVCNLHYLCCVIIDYILHWRNMQDYEETDFNNVCTLDCRDLY